MIRRGFQTFVGKLDEANLDHLKSENAESSQWQCEEVTNITIFVNHLDNSIQADTCGATISRGVINMPSTQKICDCL